MSELKNLHSRGRSRWVGDYGLELRLIFLTVFVLWIEEGKH